MTVSLFTIKSSKVSLNVILKVSLSLTAKKAACSKVFTFQSLKAKVEFERNDTFKVIYKNINKGTLKISKGPFSSSSFGWGFFHIAILLVEILMLIKLGVLQERWRSLFW